MSNPWEVLKRPFDFKDIDIKSQSVAKDDNQALAVAYFDARAAQDRLDEAFTPADWSFRVRECHLGAKSGIFGTLTVWVDGREIVREDVSELTDIEPLKGGVSGAFKRCFSQLGNRTLYDTDLGWHPCEKRADGKFKKWTTQALKDIEARYNQQVGLTPKASGSPAVEASIAAQAPLEPKKPAANASAHMAAHAATYLGEILKERPQYREYQDWCKTNKADWVALALEAKEEGCKDYDELFTYITTRKAA